MSVILAPSEPYIVITLCPLEWRKRREAQEQKRAAARTGHRPAAQRPFPLVSSLASPRWRPTRSLASQPTR